MRCVCMCPLWPEHCGLLDRGLTILIVIGLSSIKASFAVCAGSVE